MSTFLCKMAFEIFVGRLSIPSVVAVPNADINCLALSLEPINRDRTISTEMCLLLNSNFGNRIMVCKKNMMTSAPTLISVKKIQK